MAKKLTEEERQTWTQEFLKMDTDGNAWLSRNELKRGIKKLYGKKFTDVEMEVCELVLKISLFLF